MNTWPNRGASGGPCGGLDDNEIKQTREVRPRRPDSSQQASSKPGAVQESILWKVGSAVCVDERLYGPSFRCMSKHQLSAEAAIRDRKLNVRTESGNGQSHSRATDKMPRCDPSRSCCWPDFVAEFLTINAPRRRRTSSSEAQRKVARGTCQVRYRSAQTIACKSRATAVSLMQPTDG